MEYIIENPSNKDGHEIWKLVKSSNTLDLNSEYCYFMLASIVSKQCAIVKEKKNKKIVGFLSCIISPENMQNLFIWQICVAESAKKNGLAKQMVDYVVKNQKKPIEYIHVTISANNEASLALFNSLAKGYKASIEREVFINSNQFNGNHETEYLYKIGLLTY
jgi:L-2,4-diaminobutyric acid acetyltransferase